MFKRNRQPKQKMTFRLAMYKLVTGYVGGFIGGLIGFGGYSLQFFV